MGSAQTIVLSEVTRRPTSVEGLASGIRADASHELRTPITAIRGFSELHRQGAVTGEKETTELIGRIENESKRMGSLVEDLLLLARLDQAREMDSKPVDINKVVEDAVISARAAGPDHPVTLNSSNDEIFTLGDEVRWSLSHRSQRLGDGVQRTRGLQ